MHINPTFISYKPHDKASSAASDGRLASDRRHVSDSETHANDVVVQYDSSQDRSL